MLTSDDIEKITVDMINGKPPRIKGEEADEFRKRLEADLALAKKNGWEIELPFDMGD